MTGKTLQLAINKVAALPELAQEQIGREILERVNSIEHLRAELGIGMGQLDAGLGEPLDIEVVIIQAHKEYGSKY